MTAAAEPSQGSRWQRVLAFAFWSVVFGVSYTQAALYYSNQNQYFLHGLARAGHGCLDQDWLVHTKDPTPVFSFLVAGVSRIFPQYSFHILYVLLLGFYVWHLMGIAMLVAGDRLSKAGWLVMMTLLTALHAGLVRLISTRLTGVDYPWYFQAGVAGQYLLGFGLQPSVAGVFLVAAVHAFGRERPWRGTGWACLAGILHGTYLLAAAMFVIANLYLRCRERRSRVAFLQGLVALLLVLPTVIYNAVTFAPSSAESFAEAQQILARFRIPHHAVVQRWCDAIALAQVAWIILGIVLVRGTTLFWVLLIPLALSFLLTLVQVWTGNDTLALLFPWRTSAVLVPIASTIVLARLVQRVDPWLRASGSTRVLAVQMACGLTLAALTAGGVAIAVFELGYRNNPAELPLLEFVKAQPCRDAVYLLPVAVPKLDAAPRGAGSTSFTPPPKAGGHLIAIDLQRFRLITGAPIYVDFKSIPYKDVEVLEWKRRLHWANDVYAQKSWHDAALARTLADAGITHVVATADRDVDGAGLEKIYGDAYYCIYRIRAPR